MASLDSKEEQPLKSTLQAKAWLPGRDQVASQEQNHPQAFAEWRTDGKALEHPGVITWPIAIANAVLTLVGFCLGPLRVQGSSHIINFLQSVNVLFFSWILIRLFTRNRRLRHLERVQLEPDDAAVEIAIAKDGIVLGRDIGYIRFEAGCLFFQGTSTTFSFSRRNVTGFEGSKSFNTLYLSGLSRKTARIKYRVGQSTYELGLASIRAPDAVESRGYWGGLDFWLREPSRAQGVDVFPPSVPSPSTFAEARNELAAPFFVFTLFASECLVFFRVTWYPFSAINSFWASVWVWLFAAFSLLPAIRIYRRIKLAKQSHMGSRI